MKNLLKVTLMATAILAGPAHAEPNDVPLQTPLQMLGDSYIKYIFVKKCYESRQGYMVVHISEPEMIKARIAIKRLEETIKPKLPETGWTTESMWQKANEIDKDKHIDSNMQWRSGCRRALVNLMATYYKALPEDAIVEKDF